MLFSRFAFWLLLGLTSSLFVTCAHAHETTRSYVTLERKGFDVALEVRVAFRDIEVAVWMDEDLDGAITWGEVLRRLDAVDAYLQQGLALDAGGSCTFSRRGSDASDEGGLEYLNLFYNAVCPDAGVPLDVRSTLFTEIDPDHRMFLRTSIGANSVSTVLSRSEPSVELERIGARESFMRFFRSGVEHLMGGADHLVFLLVLMLPAVCSTQGARNAVLGVLAAVTGFTVAHALSLTAATTELLRPPTRLIEILIALSIVATAMDNIRPFIPAPRAAVAAFFGVIHGFGFATALGTLQLSGGALALALVGFNLGIEAAQVVVVLACLPALYVLGAGRWLLWAGSGAAAVGGMWWVWVRVAPLLIA